MVVGDFSLAVAFLAGLVSFVSPCCLPLVPTYVTYLTGASVDELSGEGMTATLRRRVILNSFAFILGFSVIFVALGLTASTVGQFLRDNMTLVRQISAILVVAFGLHMMDFLRLPFLEREMRAQVVPGRAGLRNSFLIGSAFSAGWSPCVGPVLTSILVMASQAGTAAAGGLLLATYSLGLGVPFFLTALGLGWFSRHLPRISRHLPRIRFGSGVLMVAVGIMIYFNYFATLSTYFNWTQIVGL